MTKNLRKVIYVLLSVALCLVMWEILSRVVNVSFVIPGVIETTVTFAKLLITLNFWKIVGTSILRILIGFSLGVILAIFLTPLTLASEFLQKFISLIMTVIKSTPVASIILMIWVIIGSANVPIAVAVLIVMPIIWQNLYDGYKSISIELTEVTQIFKFSTAKKIKYLILPTLWRYFFPALITSIGLAWKSGIAAEIIAYTKNSIGKEIFDAKAFFEGPEMFAWTLTVIILSLIFELLIKKLSHKVPLVNRQSLRRQK